MNFTAIDFETANRNPNSACQLGIVVVRDGKIARQESWLIRPPELVFEFTYLHGIDVRHVKHEPDFSSLWPLIHPFLEGQVIAAHNARFDLNVLSALLRHYRMGYGDIAAVDSLAVSRYLWPQLSNHQLPTVARHVGVSLQHHEAVSDAAACAAIICAAERQQAGVLQLMTKKHRVGG